MSRAFAVGLLGVFVLTAGAWAQSQQDVLANSGLGIGARAVGMGGAFTAVAEGATAMYWNPAGLSRAADVQLDVGFVGQVDNLGVFTDARDVLDAISTDNFTQDDFNTLWDTAGRLAGKPVKAEAAADLLINFGHFAFGAYGQAAGDAVLTRTPATGSFNPLTAAQVTVEGSGLGYYAVGGAYGYKVNQRLALGVTLKQLHVRRAAARFVGSYTPPTLTSAAVSGGYSQTDNNETSDEDTALAADFGLLLWPKVEGYEGRFMVGFTVQNINSPSFDLPLPTVDSKREFTFARTYNLGVAGYSPDGRWLYAADFRNLTGANDANPTGHVGVEYRARRWLALRFGLSDWTCTKGLGLDLGFLKLDAAMASRYDRLCSFSSSLNF